MDHPDQKFWKVQVYRGLELIFHLWRQAMTGEQMKYIVHRMKISHTTFLFKCLVDLDMKSSKMEGFHSYVPLLCISTFYTKSIAHSKVLLSMASDLKFVLHLFYCAQWKNSNFWNFCWMIRTQPISLLKLFLF